MDGWVDGRDLLVLHYLLTTFVNCNSRPSLNNARLEIHVTLDNQYDLQKSGGHLADCDVLAW